MLANYLNSFSQAVDDRKKSYAVFYTCSFPFLSSNIKNFINVLKYTGSISDSYKSTNIIYVTFMLSNKFYR